MCLRWRHALQRLRHTDASHRRRPWLRHTLSTYVHVRKATQTLVFRVSAANSSVGLSSATDENLPRLHRFYVHSVTEFITLKKKVFSICKTPREHLFLIWNTLKKAISTRNITAITTSKKFYHDPLCLRKRLFISEQDPRGDNPNMPTCGIWLC